MSKFQRTSSSNMTGFNVRKKATSNVMIAKYEGRNVVLPNWDEIENYHQTKMVIYDDYLNDDCFNHIHWILIIITIWRKLQIVNWGYCNCVKSQALQRKRFRQSY